MIAVLLRLGHGTEQKLDERVRINRSSERTQIVHVIRPPPAKAQLHRTWRLARDGYLS